MTFGVWRSLVSRLVRVQEAWGSNPHTPTKLGKFLTELAEFFLQKCFSSVCHAERPPTFVGGLLLFGSVPSVLFSLLLLSQLVLPLFFRFPLLTAEGFALLLVRFLL